MLEDSVGVALFQEWLLNSFKKTDVGVLEVKITWKAINFEAVSLCKR